MTHQHDGNGSNKLMDSPNRITSGSLKNRGAFVLFVTDLLSRLGPEDGLQLTMTTEPDGYVDYSVIRATTSSSAT